MGITLETIESQAAKGRQGTRTDLEHSANLAQSSNGKTRNKVGSAVGMSGKTYSKAKAAAVGITLETIERDAAKERMVTAHASPAKFAQQTNGKTRDKVNHVVENYHNIPTVTRATRPKPCACTPSKPAWGWK